MKRSLIIAAALVFALAGLSACAQESPQQTPSPTATVSSTPAQTEASVPEEAPETPAATPQHDPTSVPAEEVPEIAEPEPQAEPEQPPISIPAGIWLAKTDAGYTNYYEFGPASMVSCSLDYGILRHFTYDGAGTELTFHMENSESAFSAAVEMVSEEELILHWEGLLPETLTLVENSQTGLEDFSFYCNTDLHQLALDYYSTYSGASPEDVLGMTIGSMTNEDNTVTIQLYQNLVDHNSTAAWYIVDRFTATGIDMRTGEEIDLNA